MLKAWLRVVLAGVTGLGLLFVFTAVSAEMIQVSVANGDPDPPSPPVSWNIDLVGEISGGAEFVHLVDDLLYVGAGHSLVILDVTESALASHVAPEVVGIATLPARARDVDVVGNYAYVAAQAGGLVVIDVTDPVRPSLVATTTGILDGVAVDVAGDYAYVADQSDYVRVVDVSAALSPTLIASHRVDGIGVIVDVVVSGTVTYVGSSDHLITVDVTTPTQPVELGRYGTRSYHIEIVGTAAYVAAGQDGLHLMDVSEPATPTLVSTFDTPYSVSASAISDTQVAVADGRTGLLFVDYTEPMTPTEIGRQDTPGVAQDVALSWPYAFVADSNRGVRVLDVGTPGALQEVSAYDLPSASRCVAVSGTQAFVGEYYYASGASESLGVLRSIDLSSPATPTQTDIYTLPARGVDVVVQGPYAYVAADAAGLQIVDVSDPDALTFVGEVDTPKLATGVAVSGTMVYVADGNGGLRIIDASDAMIPTSVGHLHGDSVAVALRGRYAFLVGPYGLHVADVAEPMTPTVVATYSLGYTPDVVISSTLAYLAAGSGGLHVVDISDPLSPTQVSVVSEIEASGVSILGSKLYVVAGESGDGLTVLDISSPQHPQMIGYYRVSTMDYKDVALLRGADPTDPYIATAAGARGLVVFRVRYRIYLPLVVRQ